MKSSAPALVLASRSPRRRELLERLGLAHTVDAANIDEAVLPSESPREHVQRLARAKCAVVAARHSSDSVIIAADTTVDVDGEIFGTPRNVDEARSMLQRLSGRTHLVHTAVCTARGSADDLRCELDTAAVTMVPIDPDLLERYLATGESLDKAGAYAVQGEAAAFVASVNGHITTVIGLPVRLVERLLAPFGLSPARVTP
ncbi:MAG: Maf family protein [Ilumatobacteraceae bacterium]|jgi:septum formation protein|nr:septum formation protein Maf [Actinomycetota bacterium]NCW91150.1 septum formation protein Maf [Acidimicrobiia bacterium]NCX59703.1 septum formation protein Maf [Actinomycetota bacterium]NCZ55016.1 septum formation protein Maf [Acidimicrobiia bacterium]NCZ86153.1 septum formation protein Maf [Actinomycetota bacterium]